MLDTCIQYLASSIQHPASMDLYTDEYFMREAMKEANKAFEIGEVPVGAIVVCQNKIIGRAHNQTEKLTDATAHAEMLAVTSAANYLGSFRR